MKPSEILRRYRKDIYSIVELHKAKNPRVFGSVLYAKDTENSDLDLLIDPLPGATLFDMGAIQIELETMLGISVDVLTPGDLPKKFRTKVLREAHQI